MSNTNDLLAKKTALLAALDKVERAIAQAGFVEAIKPGVYVFGKLADGTEYKHAKVLGATAAEGTSGVWYKLRLNEDTAEEAVKSVRLSHIDGVEGAEGADPAPETKGSKSKTPDASEI